MSTARGLTEQALTCEAVLSEAAFHLSSCEYVISLVENEMLRVSLEVNRHLSNLAELAARYVDRKPDLADLCLIRTSELYPRHVVLTTDERDFRIYRRNKRDIIPILCPPQQRVTV